MVGSERRFDPDHRDELIGAYVRWLETHDPQAEWAWETLHDAVWWEGEPLAMLDTIIHIANRLGSSNSSALEELAAGPLEDLLGGEQTVMEAAIREARSSATFRTAVAQLNGAVR